MEDKTSLKDNKGKKKNKGRRYRAVVKAYECRRKFQNLHRKQKGEHQWADSRRSYRQPGGMRGEERVNIVRRTFVKGDLLCQ